MTYEHALAYLESFVNFERWHAPVAMRGVKLTRMRKLLKRLGHPQRRYRSIVVTGTNGKGSICAMLYAMLRQSQLRVGLYTSPHLQQVRERIRVEEWIPESVMVDIIQQMAPVLDDLRRQGLEQTPTYFEVLTAIALVYFNQQQVDVAVLEVGMGGRLDATNAVDHTLSVFGPINLDHTDVLGNDMTSIAMEKSGIIRGGQTVISATQPAEVADVLRSVCDAHEVPLIASGNQVSVEILRHSAHGLVVSLQTPRGRYESVSIPLVGRHQAENAAVAVAALEALSPEGLPYDIVAEGLARVEWPGRLQVVQEEPTVIFDGGHNPHAAETLRATIRELFPDKIVHLLLGISSDKLIDGVAKPLGKLAGSVTCTNSRHPRALDPDVLARAMAPYCADVHVMSDPIDAYTYVLNSVSPKDVIVVTGSFFLVGTLLAAVQRGSLQRRHSSAWHEVVADSIR